MSEKTSEKPTLDNDKARLSEQEKESPFIDESDFRPSSFLARTQRELQRKIKWQGRLPLLTVLVSGMALIVIAAQAIIYEQQRRVMNRQREVMHEQVQIMERTLRISDRAYVGVASVTADLARGQILLTLENLGKVPATRIRVQGSAYLANWSNRKLEPFPDVDFDAGEVKLFPGTLKMRVPVLMRKFDAQEISAIRDGVKGSLYVAGTISYEDGFGFDDTTNFNFKYSPPSIDSWIAVRTPVSIMSADLLRRINELPPSEFVQLIRTRNENSQKPGGADSPAMASSKAPSPGRQTPTPNTASSSSSCVCSCVWDCATNSCQFTCESCSLLDQISSSQQCCEAAKKAAVCPQ
jgi:hypothetical protein